MSMEELIMAKADKINASVPKAESEYIGDDGLLHCSVCHAPTQAVMWHPFKHKETKVGVICDCRKKELYDHKERERQEERERRRRICFAEADMMGWTFANDDRRNAKLSDAMQNYVKHFDEFRKDGKGLLLFGSVGTGKTYYASAIANALIDIDYRVKMEKLSNIVNQLQKTFDEKDEIIRSINRYTLFIFDDLGAERNSEYMKEQIFNIIDERYRSGLPFIVTTNLTPDQIKKAQDISDTRIYDRILERCFPVKVDGGSRRRQNLKDTYGDVKEKLGL